MITVSEYTAGKIRSQLALDQPTISICPPGAPAWTPVERRSPDGHILFMALRDIRPGEEITLDYVSTYHSDKKRCHCKAATCRGTINRQTN